ncbi:ATP-binding protein [Streptomyces sp. NPDC002785]|uniref:ATP-binding protein n=1 Tax=Streptomyces sp. NPDC002785 TaxID=3154543 RepID=UPI00331FE3E0
MDTMNVDVTTARSAASVAGARESARGFLDGLVHPVTAEDADTVVLVVSELVTNALRHEFPEPPRDLFPRLGAWGTSRSPASAAAPAAAGVDVRLGRGVLGSRSSMRSRSASRP